MQITEIRQRIFKCTALQVFLSVQHSETFDISHAFLRLAVAKLLTLK